MYDSSVLNGSLSIFIVYHYLLKNTEQIDISVVYSKLKEDCPGDLVHPQGILQR